MTLRAAQDDWGKWPIALDEQKLAALRTVLDETPLILEHRHYRGASSPDRLVFDDFDQLKDYLRTKTKAGDAIWCWSYSRLCKDDNAVTWGKVPDENGEVPRGGPY